MIKIIDSGLIRKDFAATYVLKNNNEVALVEVSTAHTVNRIIEELNNLKINKEKVKYIFITHIHLDHSSGSGKLMQQLPNAKLIVHPSGSKHMINPEKLIQGAIAVYGKEVVKKDYGEIIPVEENRIIECYDGQEFELGDSTLTTIHTPGHARHHISIYENMTDGIFTGDSLGLSYTEMTVNGRQFYQPTTTPTAFEYDKMLTSINKMFTFKPKKIYFTHYGESDEPLEVKKQIVKRLNDYKEIVTNLSESKNLVSDLKVKLREYYITEATSHGTTFTPEDITKLFQIDIDLNSMGLALWYERLKKH